MAAVIVCTCEICGVQRGESNHWFMAKIDSDGGEPMAVYISKWQDHWMMDERFKHVCGPGCAAKFLSKTLENIR